MLAERLDLERTATETLSAHWRGNGFVTIQPSPADGRYRVIELYREGNCASDDNTVSRAVEVAVSGTDPIDRDRFRRSWNVTE